MPAGGVLPAISPPACGAVVGHSCAALWGSANSSLAQGLPSSLRQVQTALQRKADVRKVVEELQLPHNPLDMLIDQLGGPDKVGGWGAGWPRDRPRLGMLICQLGGCGTGGCDGE